MGGSKWGILFMAGETDIGHCLGQESAIIRSVRRVANDAIFRLDRRMYRRPCHPLGNRSMALGAEWHHFLLQLKFLIGGVGIMAGDAIAIQRRLMRVGLVHLRFDIFVAGQA